MRTNNNLGTVIVPTTSRENINALPINATIEVGDETKRFIGLLLLTNQLGDCIYDAIEKKYSKLAVDKIYEEDFETHISAILEKIRDYVGLGIMDKSGW